ncbi:MAG: cytochrome C biogenesis protein CcmF [Myxococcales bacterium]|nr:cytochrome C biogenesis protein CcmF [Myxococcales bacterium]
MISYLGRGLILGALVLAVLGAITAFVAGRQRDEGLLKASRGAAYAFSVLLFVANGLMVYALLVDDFSVSYVAKVGSTKVPTWVSVVSLWSSLEGSILFWGAMLGVFVVAGVFTNRFQDLPYQAYSIGTLLACGIFFTFLLAGPANPFGLIENPLPDGPGPNPLLQNHLLMIIHPPMLYGGYVGMTLPFSYGVAALLAGHLGVAYLRPLRFWLGVAWTFLTVGIVLGGWWAYEVLGWGGFWDWDPVENASFFPWLTATAALHSALVVERKGLLKVWTLTLVLISFLLTILGTFMTRSGVFNSVHSFTQSDIGPTFLTFLGVASVLCLILLALRMGRIEDEGSIRDLKSRESAFVLNNLLFVLFTFVVVVGTVFPLLVEAIKDQQMSVGSPYFNQFAVPSGIGILFLMGIGPALPWGRATMARLKKELLPPLVPAFVLMALALGFGLRSPSALVMLFAAGYTLHVTVLQIGRPLWRRGWRFWLGPARRQTGAFIVHFGVLLIIVAIGLYHSSRVSTELRVKVGESVQLGDYSLQLEGVETRSEPHRRVTEAQIVVRRDETVIDQLKPAMKHYHTQREPLGSPAVRSSLTHDLYLSFMSWNPGTQQLGLRAYLNPMVVWLWIGMVLMVLGSVLGLSARKAKA